MSLFCKSERLEIFQTVSVLVKKKKKKKMLKPYRQLQILRPQYPLKL